MSNPLVYPGNFLESGILEDSSLNAVPALPVGKVHEYDMSLGVQIPDSSPVIGNDVGEYIFINGTHQHERFDWCSKRYQELFLKPVYKKLDKPFLTAKALILAFKVFEIRVKVDYLLYHKGQDISHGRRQ